GHEQRHGSALGHRYFLASLPGNIISPSCAISIDSIDPSFLLASKSGPSHLQTQPPPNDHLASAPLGPSCVMVPLMRLGVCRPFFWMSPAAPALRNVCRSFHRSDVGPHSPCLSTMLGNFVRPMS